MDSAQLAFDSHLVECDELLSRRATAHANCKSLQDAFTRLRESYGFVRDTRANRKAFETMAEDISRLRNAPTTVGDSSNVCDQNDYDVAHEETSLLLGVNTDGLHQRRGSVKELAAEVGIVAAVFRDIADLVTWQASSIDDLEAAVTSSLQAAKQGEDEVLRSAAMKSAGRRSMCWLCILLVAMCVLVYLLFIP